MMSDQDSIQQTEGSGKQLVKDIAPACQLPDEILSHIFLLAMYSIDISHSRQLSCTYTVRLIYRRLYAFLGVCSSWRRVVLSSSSLWTLVPVLEQPNNQWGSLAAQQSLERAVGHRLRLVAYPSNTQPGIEDFIVQTLSQHGHRFDTINIHSDSADSIRHSLASLIKVADGTYVSIKELSLCYSESIGDEISRPHIGGGTPINFHASPPLPAGVESLIESVRVLRICGMSIVPEGLSFTMLTEIRLQSLVLGPKSAFVELLEVLSSSSQLRTLELISILTIHSNWPRAPEKKFPISLPNLRDVYLEDLDLDTLEFVLQSIAPGSYTTTLNWTARSCQSVEAYSYTSTNIVFLEKLSRLKIDVLLFRRELGEVSIHKDVYYLLQAMPNITTLCLDSFYVDSEVLDALVPNTESGSEQESSSGHWQHNYKKQNTNPPGFAQLTNLYIFRSHCHDLNALRDLPKVLAHHRIQELGIGIGPDCDCKDHHAYAYPDEPESPGWGPRTLMYRSPPPEFIAPPTYDQETIDSEIEHAWGSLEGSAPRLVRFTGASSDRPPVFGFASHIWQL
ncbi:hypothetical protein ACGC1H_007683 [Rhizoctonia solani]|uniref:F-box domain-containing protein n=1 Tax=Rhizoctonia solani TaxID=456999 RepID=A0A8H3H1H8_9AGAM|nr:unnamed protein product [Rhizoctonia solani]